jgi:hypothetical protein
MCFPLNPQLGTTADCLNLSWSYDGYGWVRVKNIIPGSFTILGSLVVDGEIVSKTKFSGFTGNAITEPVDNINLDGGEF